MNDFEKFACSEIQSSLEAIDSQVASDVYVLSFYVYDLDDDPRRPVLQVGYNTRSRLADCNPVTGQTSQERLASSAQEAKWNFAFWLQNELRFIGEPGTQGAQLLDAFLQARGLYYSDDEEDADFDRCEAIGREITASFVDSCVHIAQALHSSGVIAQKFSGPVPIVVHELEYYDQIASQTRLANPPGLAKEFEDWIASSYLSAGR